MKTLIILRHGKSSWEYDTRDFDRPLSDRGIKNASEMGRFILSKTGTPDIILSSDANRALSTAKLAAESMGFPAEKIETDHELYLASVREILKSIAKLPDDHRSCVVAGHNPGLTYLVNHFGVQLDNLPTASAVCFEFNTDTWKEISPDNAVFKWSKLAREL